MTSVTMPTADFTVTDPNVDPIVTWKTQTANKVFASAGSGGAAVPGFRALVAADVPSLPTSIITSGTFAKSFVSSTGTWSASEIPSLDASKITTGQLGVANGGSGAATLTGVLKGNGTSAFTAAVAGTDFVAPGATTTSGLTMATARLLGRSTASTGAIEEISIGSGLTLSAGSLSASGGGGATVALDNLASVAVSLALTPGTDNSIAVNSAAKRYTTLFLSTGVQLLTSASDANPIYGITSSGFVAGAGGASAVDCLIARATAGLTYTAAKANSGSNVAHILDNSVALTGSTLLLSLRNNATEKFRVEDDGVVASKAPGSATVCAFSLDQGAGAGYGMVTGAAGTGIVVLQASADTSSIAITNGNVAACSGSFGVPFTGKIFLDGTSASGSATPAVGDSYTAKSQTTGGLIQSYYDNTEYFRAVSITNARFLHAIRCGGVTAMGDTNPVCRWGGNNKSNVTAVASTNSTSEHDLITYTFPTSLTANGDVAEITAFGTTGANATTKQIKLYFGATAIFDTGAVAFNAADWYIRARVIRTGPATQISIGAFDGNGTLVTQMALYSTPAETLSGNVTIKVTCTLGIGAAASDVIHKYLGVDVLPVGAV